MEAATQPTLAFAPDSAWGRCMTHFLQWLYNKSQSKATVANYQGTLTRFFSSSANDGLPKLPDAYTREDVLTFLHRACRVGKQHGGQPPSPGTVNVRLTHISSFYRFAATYPSSEQPLFNRASPTAGLAFGKVDRKYRALSLDELEKLFAAIPRETVQGMRDRAVFLTYFFTARRRSEIADLRWGDIEQAIIVATDGTRREGYLYTFHNKGRKMVDDIAELPATAHQAIVAYLKASGRLPAMRPESPLFVACGKRQRHERPLTATTMEYLLKGYARAAGIDEARITLHSFRHTSVQARYRLGEDIRSLQRLLRHASLATTDIYLNALAGTADPGATLLEKNFGKL